MASTNSTRRWQKQGLSQFSELMIKPGFEDELKRMMRLTDEAMINESVHDLIFDYKIPHNLYNFIVNYIKTKGGKDPSLISSGIKLISEFDETLYPGDDPKIAYLIHQNTNTVMAPKRILLVLDPGIRKEDIRQFVSENSDLIDQKLKESLGMETYPSRFRSKNKSTILRDKEVLRLYKEGKSQTDILKIVNDPENKSTSDWPALGLNDITQIIKRNK